MGKWIEVNKRVPEMHSEQCIIRGKVTCEYDM